MTDTTVKTDALPVWMALPKQGERCRLSGLKRGKLLSLVKAGQIKSAHLKEGNAKRGSRLVNVESLLSFLEAHSQEAEQ